ncbi:protein REVEILLE 6-like [Miscanthus floridulus]|uniref:protein REVEILLE 6-like n=1 Tax=Miscanthus floridulus TaxID=154761 RepID=UPI0034586EF8
MSAVVAKSTEMAGKKLRKPYTITNPRQKWTADEHDRFLHALVLHGRDWKRIEAFVATKTATQIRSHAQKHFLRAQKMGLAVPPVHPRRSGAVVRQAQPHTSWFTDDDAVVSKDETVRQVLLSPDHPDFALVYRFVGDVFGSDAPRPVEAQLERLLGADPVIVETILRVLENLEDNLSF